MTTHLRDLAAVHLGDAASSGIGDRRRSVAARLTLLAVAALGSLVLSGGALPSAVAVTTTYDTLSYNYDVPQRLSTAEATAEAPRASPVGSAVASWETDVVVGRLVVAANTAAAAETAGVDIARARFAQNAFSESFGQGEGALFPGQTIDDVAGSLRSGAMSPKDVPIDVIVRDGNTLILNTRSSQALIRAGFPRSSWNVIDRTGQAAYEARLSGQLRNNGLTSYGTDLP